MVVLLALAACGGAGKKDEARTEQGQSAPKASATAAAVRLNPGQWEMIVESSAMTGPSMPAEVAKMMKGMKVTTRECITPQEAERPTSNTFGGKSQGDCKQTEFSLAGGKLHAVMTCSGARGGGGTSITSDGAYGGDSFDVRSKMETDGGQGRMTMESHVTGRRVGECTGKEG
jgi:hypothetical protein